MIILLPYLEASNIFLLSMIKMQLFQYDYFLLLLALPLYGQRCLSCMLCVILHTLPLWRNALPLFLIYWNLLLIFKAKLIWQLNSLFLPLTGDFLDLCILSLFLLHKYPSFPLTVLSINIYMLSIYRYISYVYILHIYLSEQLEGKHLVFFKLVPL